MNTETITFLTTNGFQKIEDTVYANDICSVELNDSGGFTVTDNSGVSKYSDTLSIYWLIGVLSYYKCLSPDYKRVLDQNSMPYKRFWVNHKSEV